MLLVLSPARPLGKLPENARFNIFDSSLVNIGKEKGSSYIVKNKLSDIVYEQI